MTGDQRGRGWGCTPVPTTVVPPTREQQAVSTGQVWSELRFGGQLPAGKWIFLHYRTNLFDTLSRPIIRFRSDSDILDELLPAPVFGRQKWLGRVPENTVQILISFAAPGYFAFEVESCAILSLPRLFHYALRRSPRRALNAACSYLLGRKKIGRLLLQLALTTTHMRHYHEWRTSNSRALDRSTIDLPSFDWDTGPHVCFVLAASTDDTSAVATTVESIQRQVYPNWSIALVGPANSERSGCIVRRRGTNDALNSKEAIADLWHEGSASVVVAPLSPGDMVPEHAAAVLAEHVAATPDIDTWYADDDTLDQHGRFAAPNLKPDWSPIFNEVSGYALGAVYFRPSALLAAGMKVVGDILDQKNLATAFATTENARISHIRRVLLTRANPSSGRYVPVGAAKPTARRATNRSRSLLTSIIIPSKEKVDTLRRCLASINLNETEHFEVLIIDNGSTNKATWDFYETLRADRRVRVVAAPGPFNFSKLCNLGAASAHGSTLLFLNNDTRTDQVDWLRPLTDWANEPEVGAVGPKLVYPTGRLQHTGVVLGLGGLAAHIERGAAGHSEGYLRRVRFPHEVSAVTGACLTVAKVKFERVGGFDAAAFPVELNDIDLCLRLKSIGWKTIFTPETILIHEESATRGEQPASRYAGEQYHFRNRWGHLLGDDPTFHPALSLQSEQTLLE